ncbi:hypothetical protein NEOKW01_1370 [Nematocida sp. AWRm80]|nr:hypothetical protein NEOKW01_1370 [Nematocida sp. AWRm80]
MKAISGLYLILALCGINECTAFLYNYINNLFNDASIDSSHLKPYLYTSYPTRGRLYNHGSHGYLSKVQPSSSIYMPSLVVIDNDQSHSIEIYLVKPNSKQDLYHIKVFKQPTDSKSVFASLADTGEALSVDHDLHATVHLKPYDSNDATQKFWLEAIDIFDGYFRIKYAVNSDVYCLTPNRKQVLVLEQCWGIDDPAMSKQFYKIESSQKKNLEKLYIPNGITSNYFEGRAPCTRGLPDHTKGSYVLMNKNYCLEKLSEEGKEYDHSVHYTSDEMTKPPSPPKVPRMNLHRAIS